MTSNAGPSRHAPWALLFLGLLVVGLVVWALRLSGGGEPEGVRATLSAAQAIAGGDTAGFARATEVRDYVFPRDHGPHPEYRTEWWYLTGNLEDEDGRPWGFQVTFFRNSVTPDVPERRSAWSTNQTWMAHFALVDIDAGRHVHGERFSRGAAGLAGGQAEPFRVWLEDWELAGGEEEFFPLRLRATHGEASMDLRLEEGHPMVRQGDRGLSQKGPDPGNASHYLTWPRMPVEGRVQMGDRDVRVTGQGWMDREWSTSALGEEHVGWDWFSIQLDDGRNLMFFELRRDDGLPDPLNHGSVSGPGGLVRTLGAGDVEIQVLDTWASPLDGAEYPSGWQVEIPSEGLSFQVTPRLRDQEMNTSFRYWEGAVLVEGDSSEGPVSGVGYVELTGYGEDAGTRESAPGSGMAPG
ncbi:MAG: carotenoid 1,2-hydratase [Gemmatimonadales bacterium]|nr:MAG: carotenoid 1,2-hydratase [Gemmatimonadales bacterium]